MAAMARWHPRIVLPALGAVAVAVVVTIAVVSGGSSPHHPPGLTVLTTTTLRGQGAIWSGEVPDGVTPNDVPLAYVESVLGGSRSMSIELGPDAAVAHFS